MKDYFTDLELDYHFFKQLNGYKIKIDGAWHQYNHIAKVLNRNNRFAWGIKYIDSNYDGMVNPLNGFRTYKRECMRFFEEEFLNPKWISLKAKRMYLGFC